MFKQKVQGPSCNVEIFFVLVYTSDSIRIFYPLHLNWTFFYTFIYRREIAKHLSLPPVKLHCSMLAEDAIKAAVKDYEAKKGWTSQKSDNAEAAGVANAWILQSLAVQGCDW